MVLYYILEISKINGAYYKIGLLSNFFTHFGFINYFIDILKTCLFLFNFFLIIYNKIKICQY